jgi:hypothetical protein
VVAARFDDQNLAAIARRSSTGTERVEFSGISGFWIRARLISNSRGRHDGPTAARCGSGGHGRARSCLAGVAFRVC